jgi:hypothetical protein
MTRACACALLVLFLAAACLFGQEPGTSSQSPRRLMLSVDQKTGTGFTPDELTLLSRSMLLALQEARGDLVLVEPVRTPQPGSDLEITTLAQESGADCWIHVELSGSRTDAILRVRSFDVLDGTVVFEKTVPRQGGDSAAQNLVGERWEDIAAFLQGTYPPRASATALPMKNPDTISVTFQGIAGTRVKLSGAGSAKATLGADGTANVELPSAGTYELRATRLGSLTVKRKLVVRGDRTLALDQKKAPRMAIDASALLAWPGVAFSWAPIPDLLFLRAGLTTYLLGLVMREDTIFTSDPLTTIDILAGLYVLPSDSAWRLYAGLGGFLRVVHAPGELFAIDPLAPGGLQAALGIEARLAGPIRLFAEYEPMLYLTRYGSLFASAMGDSPGWVFFPQAALQMLSLRLGVRWHL